jgi:predicted dinucleotide-binding enzyme
VVKAFNTTFAGTLLAGHVAGHRLDVFVAADDPGAARTVSTLVERAGLRPIPVGPLRRARELEAMGFLNMIVQEPLGTKNASALKILG